MLWFIFQKQHNKLFSLNFTQVLVLFLFLSFSISESYSAENSDMAAMSKIGPKLEFVGGGTYDWGRVRKNQNPLKAKIQVKNSGDEDLRIFSVKPSCGCTTAPISKDIIKPGESATIDVALNISKQSGNVTKGITVTSNDTKNDKLTYMIKCEVYVPLTVFPKILALGTQLVVGKETIGKIVITNNSDKKVKILGTKGAKGITFNIKEGQILAPKENFALEAKFTPTKTGVVNEELIILNDSEDAELTINLVGQVVE